MTDEKKELLEQWAERAAIKEFCGNLPRGQAEQEATEEIYGKPE